MTFCDYRKSKKTKMNSSAATVIEASDSSSQIPESPTTTCEQSSITQPDETMNR